MIFDFSVKTYLTKRVVYDLIDLIGDLRSDPQIDSGYLQTFFTRTSHSSIHRKKKELQGRLTLESPRQLQDQTLGGNFELAWGEKDDHLVAVGCPEQSPGPSHLQRVVGHALEQLAQRL